MAKYSDDQKTALVQRVDKHRDAGLSIGDAIKEVRKEKGFEWATAPTYTWWKNVPEGKPYVPRVQKANAAGLPTTAPLPRVSKRKDLSDLSNVIGPRAAALDGLGGGADQEPPSLQVAGARKVDEAELERLTLKILDNMWAARRESKGD